MYADTLILFILDQAENLKQTAETDAVVIS